ncbi:MAG: hypothetical protein LWX56_14600 [Ignavibacteria bacterium]|nr:hypothetical protein [Ignavibacteria bacterium]
MLNQKHFIIVILVYMVFPLCAQNTKLVDKIGLHIKNESRVFTFTNKAYSQYHGQTNSYSDDGWHGWICREQKLFTDYIITVNHQQLDRSSANTTVLPYLLKREYAGGIIEELLLPDEKDALSLHLSGIPNGEFHFRNFYPHAEQLTSTSISFDIHTILPGYKLTVYSNATLRVSTENTAGTGFRFSGEGQNTFLYFTINSDLPAGIIISDYINSLQQQKRDRINSVLERTRIVSNDEDFNSAYLWAVASMDALVTKQDVKGIFAGLPWFNNNWGRDTFISLPGACLVNGNFTEAREVLEAFGAYQNKDEKSPYYGRIPNRVTLKDIIYNTADGTPWFIIQAYKYWLFTSDSVFLQKVYPSVKFAFTAAEARRVDKLGFLTHADAETWMDAVGPDGPWSPRGNRANDIQFLWAEQCRITAAFAQIMKDKQLESSARAALEKVQSNFAKSYIDIPAAKMADHITASGKRVMELRPNVFFPLQSEILIKDASLRQRIFLNAFPKLVMSNGVLSLSAEDRNFHPFHEYAPFYPKDAAYHNGIIWQWNAGPVINLLTAYNKPELAWELLQSETEQILHRGAAGTLAELMDAFPRDVKTPNRLSGAFSQAWSLAEYIRNIRENILGISIVENENTIKIAPCLPEAISDITFPVFYRNSVFQVKFTKENKKIALTLLPTSIKDDFSIQIEFARGNAKIASTELMKTEAGGVYPVKLVPIFRKKATEGARILKDLKFAQPKFDSSWASIKKPDYLMLKNADIKQVNPAARHLFSVETPSKDEKYRYPINPKFEQGILDITGFQLYTDNKYYYFTLTYANLTDPKWHAEFGYQLTFSGIYIGNRKFGGTDAGKNSKYSFSPARSFERVIYVGGGLEIQDNKGKILAVYNPVTEDITNPLGNVKTRSISFSIPCELIGPIGSQTKITVLVGAQDDHGGSGVGEFREVMPEAQEWFGGGKKSAQDSNIFDILLIN